MAHPRRGRKQHPTFCSSFSRVSLMASTLWASLSSVHPPPITIPSSTAACRSPIPRLSGLDRDRTPPQLLGSHIAHSSATASAPHLVSHTFCGCSGTSINNWCLCEGTSDFHEACAKGSCVRKRHVRVKPEDPFQPTVSSDTLIRMY